MRFLKVLCLACVLLSFTACQPRPLEDALKGALPLEEANLIITEYCQNCHIHRTFDPVDHTTRVQDLYDRPPYTTTTACRTCHLVHKDTWGIRLRKTIWPAQVATQQGEG